MKTRFALLSLCALLLSACGGNTSSAMASSTSSSAPASSTPASSAQPTSVVDSSTPVESSKEESSVEPESSSYDPTLVTSIVERSLPVYRFGQDEEGNVYTTKSGTTKVYTINGEDIPYVSFDSFVTTEVNWGDDDPNYTNYSLTTADHVATVVNPVNGSSLTFDADSRVATYKGIEMFPDTENIATKEFFGCVFGSSLFNDSLTTYEYYEGKETISYSLADYDINAYVHRGKVFIPYTTMCALFHLSTASSLYCYTGNAFYRYTGAVSEAGLKCNEIINANGTDWITQDYLLSSYNNLALALDMEFGLDEHQSRVTDGKTYTYMENGAYAMLAPYKDKLLSTDPDVSNDALCELFMNDLDDGGHDKYVSTNLLSTKIFTRADVSGPESKNTLVTMDGVAAARKEKGIDIASVLPNATKPNGYYKEYGDTAYIQFDEFTLTQDSYTLDSVAALDYSTDSITLFHYANEQIQNNSNIKNVIIDLSGNGGGVMFTSEFIASWACGGNDGAIRYASTGTTMSYRMEADVNFDGVFDEKDYLSSDINLYVMISNGSFSCGNKLPCNIYDNRPNNTHFIGSRTGGGSCAVSYLPINYLGGQIRISSQLQIGRKGSTQDNFITNEAGVSSDFYSIENSDYAAFADIDTIINKIHESK